MPISFHGISSVPADNGSNATATITITPPASMLQGDLVVVYLQNRAFANFSVGVTGGQTWNFIERSPGGSQTIGTYWARYNGTWAANPRFDFSQTTSTSARMLVFRANSTASNWSLEQFASVGDTTNLTKTVTGITPSAGENVTIAAFMSTDDNTWGTLSGTNWVQTGIAAQYRNLAGNDTSAAFAYQIQTTAAPTNNVSLTQLTLGPDETNMPRATFIETQGEVFSPSDPMGTLGFFGL
jgi:hypothetical protein